MNRLTAALGHLPGDEAPARSLRPARRTEHVRDPVLGRVTERVEAPR